MNAWSGPPSPLTLGGGIPYHPLLCGFPKLNPPTHLRSEGLAMHPWWWAGASRPSAQRQEAPRSTARGAFPVQARLGCGLWCTVGATTMTLPTTCPAATRPGDPNHTQHCRWIHTRNQEVFRATPCSRAPHVSCDGGVAGVGGSGMCRILPQRLELEIV